MKHSAQTWKACADEIVKGCFHGGDPAYIRLLRRAGYHHEADCLELAVDHWRRLTTDENGKPGPQQGQPRS